MVSVVSMLKRTMSSTFVLVIAGLLIIDLVLWQFMPLRFFSNTALTAINQFALVSKLPEILSSRQNADLLLLGSSMILVPAVHCDDELHGTKPRFDRWYYRHHLDAYKNADCFEKLLQDDCGKHVSVLNGAVVAAMMSDQYLIARKYLASGKRPKIVVVGVAPREFLDNQRALVEKTATYTAIADFSSLNDLFGCNQMLPTPISKFNTAVDCAMGLFWYYWRSRSDYKSFVATLSTKVFHHPLNLYEAATNAGNSKTNAGASLGDVFASESVDPMYVQPPNTLQDINEYKKMYWPINKKLFATQEMYFEKLLKLLQEHNIPVVIVLMPLTNENLALLPADVLDNFKDTVSTCCSKYGAYIFDPGKQMSFSHNDFEDSAHMNSGGGKKLFMYMSNAIATNKRLAACLVGQ